MLWKIFQTSIFCWVVYIYTTQIDPKNPPMGAIIIIAILVTYVSTRLLSLILNIPRTIINLLLRRRALRQELRLRRRQQQAQNHGRITTIRGR